jgi:hypothetical protein
MRADGKQMTTEGLMEPWATFDWTNGVQIDELRALATLSVRTRNSTYEIVVTAPSSGDILVRGGSRFPALTPARLCGSTIGGSVLKRSGVYPGLRVELESEGRRILTSPVVSIKFNPAAAAVRPRLPH